MKSLIRLVSDLKGHGFTACGKTRSGPRFERARLQPCRTRPLFLAFRAGFSPRGICFPDFFRSLFSRAAQSGFVCHREPTNRGPREAPLLRFVGWRLVRVGSALPAFSTTLLLACTLAPLIFLAACSIKVDDKDKEAKKVDIQTPLANLKVDTSAASTDNGIPVYPGATPRPEEGGDKHRANVNIGAMGFGVRVIAAEYITPDSPEKVKTFYLDKLKKFGNVLECTGTGGDHGSKGNWNNMDEGDKPVSCGNSNGDGWELKTGTNNNQHLVSIKPDGSGTRFGTVLVQIHGKEGNL